jgi:predicted acetyltransferase
MPDVRQQPEILRMAKHIRLSNARDEASHREWLTNVYSFYLHDLSQFAPDEYRLTALGHWEPDHLPYWLSHAFCHPLVLLEGSVPVGFAFVGQAPFPFMSAGIRFRVAEFFILRSRRRSGVGRSAAHAALAAFPGFFELTVLGRNAPALAFWRSVLPEVATAPIREASSHGDVHFTFNTAAA